MDESHSAFQAAIVTVSDGVAGGVRDDASGRALASVLDASGFAVAAHEVVPDEREQIAATLLRLARSGASLVLTTGGTGLGPRDVTPEATRDVIEREAPGLAEAMREAGRASTPFAALSREVVGSVGSTLIVNLPGSERGAVESLNAILPVLPHALELVAGRTAHGPSAADTHTHGEPGGKNDDRLASHRADEPFVVATAVRVEGNPPCRVGQKIFLGRHGALSGTLGCAEFDQAAIDDAPSVIDTGKPITHTYAHELGSIEVYLEPNMKPAKLVVFSATPVALHLLRWARDLGFETVLVEPRPGRVMPEHHEAAALVVTDIEGLPLDDRTDAVHTDHDAPGLVDSVAALLRSPAPFIGVMGSARHVGPYVDELRSKGFSDADLTRVRTPVGIDIGAQTAEEIALSILAGLVAARRDASGGWLDRRS